MASTVVDSPVVAVAVPFETPSGRRVFSAAIRPATGSLRIYLDTVVPLAGRTYLIDELGNVVVSGLSGERIDVTRALTAGALLRLDAASGEFETDGIAVTYVRERVPGTPWHVILTTPSALLYEPVEDGSDVSWLLFAAFAFSGLVGLILYFRLARSHAVADDSAHSTR